MRSISPFKYLSIAAAAVAATTVLTLALPSFAQPTPAPMPPHTMGGMHQRMTPEQMSTRAQKRLDKMEKKLNIQPGQQAAWGAYKSATLAQATERAAKMKEHHDQMQRNAGKELSAPERMEQHAKMMREQADAMSRHAQNVQQLYQTLSPEQRTIFDMMQARGMHNMRHEMRHGMKGGMHDMHGGMMPKSGAAQR